MVLSHVSLRLCADLNLRIIFRTDPATTDYAMVSGALRNMEPWRNKEAEKESIDDRLDRLEKEEAEAAGEEQEEKNAMADLEARTQSAREEIEVADALDRIRMRNAARARASTQDIQDGVVYAAQEQLDEEDRLDAEAARRAFEKHNMSLGEEIIEEVIDEVIEEEPLERSNGDIGHPASTTMPPPPKPAPVVARKKKQKKDYAGMLGIKPKKS
jgi:hypothetical protein